ncbi:MAG: nickel pincer cofactor biosynthesis protein LarC [Candidatus Lokiarchaeota archaeon]|nr:nickel pincer cofactor biosynthesis protein LarC [Candidatus Lokiarchaeota archaeon]
MIKQIFYINCKHSGLAGDMFLAALYGLNENSSVIESIQAYINDNFSNVKILHFSFKKIQRNGIYPYKMDLRFTETRPELQVQQIKDHISKLCGYLNLSPLALQFADAWFNIILDAEQNVHNIHTEKIHLHELGSIDTLIDICGSTALLEQLSIFSKDPAIQIYCSEVAIGGGLIKISHGTVPVPAPATTYILEKYSIPLRGGPIERELLTPTGAALLACLKERTHFCFASELPPMQLKKTSISTGQLGDKDFPNIFQIFTGISILCLDELEQDVIILETMVDDQSGETLGSVMEDLFEKGALDVNYITVHGKKNRPGILVRVLTTKSQMNALMKVLFQQLGTLGIRYRKEKRICLNRDVIENTTTIEGVTVKFRTKIAYDPSNPKNILYFKIEHDDIVRISRQIGISLSFTKVKLESAVLARNTRSS